MITEMRTRKYRQTRRAEAQAQTHERIVDAAIELHEELGPAATTISALAERAGVQRLTVYKHFPDDRAILAACSAKWLSLYPPPALEEITVGSAAERAESMLLALYRYYGRTERMWAAVYRDLPKLPQLAEAMQEFEAYLASIRKCLLRELDLPGRPRLRAVIGHALRFSTWQSLAQERLSAKAMAELVGGWIRAAAS